ncbi:division/cell wall cluster transcriptional repressor MraZ [Candidatus Gottesmanbacteria bacterium RBG_13_45_10]|uniref:Transcriptional regulator MraZ n=1 Tax=Candidatus Gottesmanbacteria bacterium RBG_13_45_10 TaxID=1798370 RepID=A0A1F5ZFV7_9BACT|nr:MAG: division/cell wall cluster transcriptional repressor MraZ [Candidatus Gottesmanbacteria bacterium RBG_13_45_10]
MKLFLGEYDHALDDRGRVTLPRKIRQELEEREIILSRGFDACIFGFDRISWEREAAKQLEAPVIEARARDIRRYMFAGAEKVEVDKLGRILLPALLKEYASIVRSVMVIGAGDHFEIWDTRKWEAYAREHKTP